jgi:hypothetical protein
LGWWGGGVELAWRVMRAKVGWEGLLGFLADVSQVVEELRKIVESQVWVGR